MNKQTSDEKMETDAPDSEDAQDADDRVVPQILVLYYLLLYEDVRMSQIKAITVRTRQKRSFSQIPVSLLSKCYSIAHILQTAPY